MRSDFRDLRLKQLDRSLEPYRTARLSPRPPNGWIRALRQHSVFHQAIWPADWALAVSSHYNSRRAKRTTELLCGASVRLPTP